MYNNNNVAGAYDHDGFWGCGRRRTAPTNTNVNPTNVAGATDLTPFLRQLSPGTCVKIQYDCQPPAFGVFQGFQNGLVLLDRFNGFPGLTRLLPSKINAVAPVTAGHCHRDHDDHVGGMNEYDFGMDYEG